LARRCIYAVVAALAAVQLTGCGGDGGDGATGSTREPNPEDRVEVERAFCDHMMPLTGVNLDLLGLSGGEMSFSDEELLLVSEATPATLQAVADDLETDSDAFLQIGDQGMASASRAVSDAARALYNGLISGDVTTSLFQEYDTALRESGLPEGYCADITGDEFLRGYVDGWLAEGRETETGEYAVGYDAGFSDGWRDGLEGEQEVTAAQELRDALGAVLSAEPGAYEGITQLRDADIDYLGTSVCKGMRLNPDAAPEAMADALVHTIDGLSSRDAAVAVGMFVAVYCPRLASAG
jgi:hypothetical protein